MGIITFTKVKLPFGWLSNMAAYPLIDQGELWPTAEALFQASRYVDPGVREKIRSQRSPMAAKFVARNKDLHALRVVVPHGERDIDNMRRVLRAKYTHYPKLRRCLIRTMPHGIVADCSRRGAAFWGARLIDGEWYGENMLGKLLMELRGELIAEDARAHGAPFDQV